MTDRKEHLKTWLNSWIVCESLPGALWAVYDKEGQELFYHEVDQSIVKSKVPQTYTKDSIFRIYSMTKPITSVAALILLDRGLLSLDDHVSKFIPSFANAEVFVGGTAKEPVLEALKEPIKIRHIMTHTSGLTYGIFGTLPSDEVIRQNVGEDWKNWYMNTELEVLCDKVAAAPLVFQPGTGFLYGLSSDVLGRVIEVVSGMKLDVFMAKEIFEPLGMVDTGFVVSADKLHRLVEVYDFNPAGHGYKLATHPERARNTKHTMTAGGGGLVSTLGDYSRFARCLLNKGVLDGVRILSESTVTLMTSNQLPNNANITDIGRDGFSEGVGEGYGFGLGVAVLTNPNIAKGASLSGLG